MSAFCNKPSHLLFIWTRLKLELSGALEVNDSRARQSVSRFQFRPARPSGSSRGGRRLDMIDEILDLVRQNRAIGYRNGRQISSGACYCRWPSYYISLDWIINLAYI